MCSVQQCPLLSPILLQGTFRGWWLSSYKVCLVFVIQTSYHSRKEQMRRRCLEITDTLTEGLIAFSPHVGRASVYCRTVLDSNHPGKIGLCAGLGSQECSWIRVCVGGGWLCIYIHLHTYVHITHTYILESFKPKIVVGKPFHSKE